MIFETEQDLKREHKAITTFVNIDYKVFDKEGKLIAYVEVKSRVKTMRDAYPLPIAAKKIVKLADKRLNPVIVWSCEDGIIYGKINKLKGEIKWGGRTPRDTSINDLELMVLYDKQKELKYIRFV